MQHLTTELLKNIPQIINRYLEIYQKILEKNSDYHIFRSDPLQLKKLFIKVFNCIISDPDLIIKYQISFFKTQLEAIENIHQHYDLPYKDKRFQDELWQDHVIFNWIKNSYLTYIKWLDVMVDELPEKQFTKIEIRRVKFFIKQFVDAVSPSNFPATNPKVLKEFFDTAGQNFLQGLDNLYRDIENSTNILSISNNDNSKFAIGKNIATTKGKVVYKNDIIELIHYQPLTKLQYKIPLLIIPPFINKYYILDLQSENSFVKWLLEENFNVFLVSWVNPDESLKDKDFSDYMNEGILQPLDYITKTLEFSQVNTLGYCIGGTLLATCIAYLKKINDNRIKTATFLTTLINFEDAGELSIFVDDFFIEEIKQYMESNGGFIEGRDMAATFNLLRPNDMIWPFYINNYLLGKEAFPFDVLFWNEDSTRIPITLQLTYLKDMYQNNLLKEPNKIKINNTPINISEINIPCFFVASKNDHIVPWNNAFTSAQLFSGPVDFILVDSGHVAGIINHPSKNKYRFWQNNSQTIKEFLNEKIWLKNTQEHPGSWWKTWSQWASGYSEELMQAKLPELLNPNIIENAPGSYIKIKF